MGPRLKVHGANGPARFEHVPAGTEISGVLGFKLAHDCVIHGHGHGFKFSIVIVTVADSEAITGSGRQLK